MAPRILRTVLISALGLSASAGPSLAQPPTAGSTAEAPAHGSRGRGRGGHGRRAAPTALVVGRPGFQMGPDGTSRFAVTLSAAPTYDVRSSRRRVEIRIANARIAERNVREPLETRYFETPVLRMKVEPRGHDVYVVFELRSDATPAVTVEIAAEGGGRLVAAFGAGQFRTAAERDAVEGALAPTPAPAPTPAAAPPPAQTAPAQSTPLGYDDERPPAMNTR
ncbi:MAG: hypothetical protein U0230_18415 [Polyangiales bacterium]